LPARTIRRRQFLSLTGLAAGTAAVLGTEVFAAAPAAPVPQGADPNLLDEFLALPGKKSAEVDVGDPQKPWRSAYAADVPLFCGSCFKTFVLASYLQEIEAGRLSGAEQLDIDDSVRSVGGGVFDHLSGTATARNVLEAMIAHSDNTATDVAMRRVGADTVRTFIKNAGLKDTRIPDSTRRFFSYIAGYPPGEDMGWKGLVDLEAGKTPGPSRPVLNDVQTMVCPASQFVSYYKRALAGDFFRKPETLTDFRRIQSMADAIAIVPPNTPAYLKGGSIDWAGFYCMATAGQMIAGRTPVTFCLTLNWHESEGKKDDVEEAYKKAVGGILGRVLKRQLGAGA
jgi:beta-lactamase class A